MIKLDGVSKYYATANNVAMGLQNVSCELNLNEIVAIVGQSGSGKSTFLNVITGVDSFEDGEITFNNEALSGFTKEELEDYRRNNVSFIFQNYNLVDSYTVLQNVMLPLIIKGMPKKEAKEKALEIIKEVGLEKRFNHKGTKLSGGEKQRVVIARALASDSKILACDEPTGNLDSKTGEEIIKLIKKVAKNRLVLIVTHNYEQIKDIATRLVRIHDGSIVEDKILSNVINEEQTEESIPLDKMKRKQHFMISLMNILSTPKKSIFIFLVLFVISFIMMTLYSNIKTIETTNYSYYSSNYINMSPNRYIITKKDKTSINMEDFKDLDENRLIKNSEFEDASRYYLNIYDYTEGFYCASYVNTSKIEHLGTLDVKDNEIALGVSKSSWNYYADILNETVNGYKIVGIFEYYENQSSKFIYGNFKTLSNLYPSYSNLYLVYGDYQYFNNLQINEDLNDNQINLYIPNTTDTEYLKREIAIENKNKSYKADFLNISILQSSTGKNYATMNSKTYQKIYDQCNLQISYYTIDQNEVTKINELLKGSDYVLTCPALYNSGDSIMTKILTNFMKLTMTLVSFVAICFAYLFSALILSRVFATKVKDYTILRVLGNTKKDLSNILIYEMLLIGFCSSILMIMLALISKFNPNFMFGIGAPLNFFDIIVFTVLVLIFSYFMARRFNRKLFKNTVQSSLKEEGGMRD